MFLQENIQQAVSSLRSNKVRSFLTMLGIIIGISAVIAIVSIGNAVTASVTDTMAGLGANNIYAYVALRENDSIYGQMSGSGTSQIDDSNLLTEDQINAVRQKFSDDIGGIAVVDAAGSGAAQNGHRKANITAYGVNSDYFNVENIDIQKGRSLRDSDMSGSRRVAVVSDKLVSALFPGSASPLGKQVDVEAGNMQETFTIVGVYKSQTSAMRPSVSEKDITTNLYVPVSVAKETSQNQNYSQFEVKLKNVENADVFTNKLKSYLTRLYANNTKYTCGVYNMENMISSISSVLGTLSIAIAAIAAIALLVGGVGVMNIMLVSVTERTREIGTRKALGARSGQIKMQFIVESMIICLIGGILGVIFGILMAWGGVSLLGMKMTVSVPIIFISVAFSMLIGVFFGYYPASKASRMDPIEALRYE